MDENAAELAKMIDHTLLKPDATYEQVERLCREAVEYGFAAVCVNPVHVKRCAETLRGSGIPVCTVAGFPLGATTTETKVFETHQALCEGASEVDMVINLGALKAGDHETAQEDIAALARTCHAKGALLKVIIETALLTDEEKVIACQLAKRAGADFVKTSTGFGPGGATAEDVALMRKTVGPEMGVKAAGGIRTYADAQRMIAAGANRLGASASIQIIKGAQA
jgi:deoxyribose-phosphate aldolase